MVAKKLNKKINYQAKKYSLPVIKSLMQKIAAQNAIPQEVNNTWKHSQVVYNFAKKIAHLAIENGFLVNLDYLKPASFVHDIGRMKTGSPGSKEIEPAIYHGLRGYNILKKEGYPESLARICLVHLGGAGLDKKTNQKYGIFKNRNTLAETIEEKIIAYADMRTSFDQKKKKPVISSFKKAYQRFKKYPRLGPKINKNHQFIKKITNHQIT
ncbi:MAG: HDIG domain-containing protein [Patescibacteria group bacterium]|nr:HDIG domain-containing protein [Patescibacteria group bacterium]